MLPFGSIREPSALHRWLMALQNLSSKPWCPDVVMPELSPSPGRAARASEASGRSDRTARSRDAERTRRSGEVDMTGLLWRWDRYGQTGHGRGHL
jgi:hypothetical protein